MWMRGTAPNIQDDYKIYYIASIVSEHVYKVVDCDSHELLGALNDVLGSTPGLLGGSLTMHVSRLDVDQKYMVLETGECIYVGMMGTKSLDDVLVDGQVQKKSVPFSVGQAAAHAGFLKRAMDIPIHALYRYACIVKGKRLVVCGHSLGGAVAALVTYRLVSETGAFDSVLCITFGSPGVYENGAMMKGYDGFLNFLAEDDPMCLVSKVSTYKHIGRLFMLPKTGIISAGKHRMGYYSKYMRTLGLIESIDGYSGVIVHDGVVMPPVQVCLVEGRCGTEGEATLCVDIYGDHLDFVSTVRLISTSRKLFGVITKQCAERISALFLHVSDEVMSQCQDLSVLLQTDFERSTYPVKIKRPDIWVISHRTLRFSQNKIGKHSLMHGAHVWDISSDLDMRRALDFANIYAGGTLDQVSGWMERSKMSRIVKNKIVEYPLPDAILVMGRVNEPSDVYYSMYKLSNTLTRCRISIIYNIEERLPQHAHYKIKTLTGISQEHIISHDSIESAVHHTVLLLQKYHVLNSKM